MRIRQSTFAISVRVAVTLAVTTLAACGDETPPPAPPTIPDVATEPRVVVAAGPHRLDVEPHASGQIYAYPGPTVVAPTETTITIDAPVAGGTRPVTMRWDERDHRFEGRLRGATIIPGSLTVHVLIGDVMFVGTNTIVIVLPAIVVVETRHKYRGKHRGKWR